MGINGAGITEVIIIPDIVEDLLSGKSNTLVLYKVGQKFKLLVAQINRLSVNLYKMGRLVNADAAHLSDLTDRYVGTAQNGLDPGHQNFGTERLGNVFIHTKLKALKLVPLLAAGCQHDDRHLGILAHGL